MELNHGVTESRRNHGENNEVVSLGTILEHFSRWWSVLRSSDGVLPRPSTLGRGRISLELRTHCTNLKIARS